ncbi:bleomycin resistance protein [Carnobacterium sp. TMP28]|uniref:bleomycin resistance protein n=1 Tax=Carnobacterium sp. TMP28 TaxID=3397060 RepID=UPI0039E175B2
MDFNKMVPELTVFNIKESKHFYIKMLGFKIIFERPEDNFIFIELNGTQLMLEEYHKDGWNVGDMRYPLGQGINFEIEVKDINTLYENLSNNQITFYKELKETIYKVEGDSTLQKEFIVQDPNGYMLRFVS